MDIKDFGKQLDGFSSNNSFDNAIFLPDDVAIISFDNNRFLDFLNPSITRIEQPVNLVGKLVVDCITQLIDEDDEDSTIPLQTLLRPTLIEGRSC